MNVTQIQSTPSFSIALCQSDDEDAAPPSKDQRKHHPTQSSKISHSCVEDFQLLSNRDDIIQKIFDYLCYTLGDVYTNLNDGCMRFMQTDTYFRWFNNNFKKDKGAIKEEDEDGGDTSDEDKNNNKKKIESLKPGLEEEDLSSSVNINENEQEKRPMKG